jgi:20S proteasome subunit beta 4
VNLLIAGFEKDKGPVLYWMDYLAAMQPMPFALHGYGAFFCLGLLDKLYKPSMGSFRSFRGRSVLVDRLNS